VFHSLLSPIGQYRAANITPAKGKRSKKRKRKEDKSKGEETDFPRPPPLEISSFVVVGLNSITRSLETLSQKSKALRSVDCEKNDAGRGPQSPRPAAESKSDAGQVSQRPASEANDEGLNISEKPLNGAGQYISPGSAEKSEKSEKRTGGQTSHSLASGAKHQALNNAEKPPELAAQSTQSSISEEKSEKSDTAQLPASDDIGETAKELLVEDVHRHFSAIFVTQASQPPILRAHLPQLVTTASLANPELPATRLVQLPKGCEARLSEALALPRVSFIGILDGAPHSKSLVDLARESVPVIEIPWLEEAKKSVYLPLKINAIESFVHVVAKKVEKSA
jgi:hypothetical protein